ncbi:MAG: hypothetical protein ACI30J_00665 [Paludibacteraceae bacterium]
MSAKSSNFAGEYSYTILIAGKSMKQTHLFWSITMLMLTTLPCFAQDFLFTQSGEYLKVYKADIGATHIYYYLSDTDTASVHAIPKKEVYVVKKENGLVIQIPLVDLESDDFEIKSTKPLQITPSTGFLLKQGCSVFVTSNTNEEWDRKGAQKLKELIKEDGFWKVVETPDLAHFILQYGVCLKGYDLGMLVLRNRNSFLKYPICDLYTIRAKDEWSEGTIPIMGYPSSESLSRNTQCAERLYKDAVIWESICKDSLFIQSVENGTANWRLRNVPPYMGKSSVKQFVCWLHDYWFIPEQLPTTIQ